MEQAFQKWFYRFTNNALHPQEKDAVESELEAFRTSLLKNGHPPKPLGQEERNMDWTNFWIILLGIVSAWFLCLTIRGTVKEIGDIRRCSAEITADILSWTEEEDGDNPTRYIPTIRYAYGGQVYETFFLDGALTWYQKEHRDTGDTLTIFLDPENPATITPEQKCCSMFGSIGVCICVGIAVFPFLLFAFGKLIYAILK